MAADFFSRKRLAVTVGLIIFLFVLLLFRLSWLQLVQGEELSRMAADVRTREEVLEPRRGIIYDRNHVEMVGNNPVKSIYANPDIFSLQEAAEKEKVIRQMADILGINGDNLARLINAGQPFAWIKHRVDYATCQKLTDLIKEYKIKGINFVDGTARYYPRGTMAAHVMGFVGMDPSARSGIEKSYDADLSGVPGRLLTEIDAGGRELPQARSQYIPPVPGKNLVLTIDQTIQYYVERELDKVEEKYKPSRSSIIVMDPGSGEVLAMGSRPSYDPGRYSDYPQQVWDFNPAVHFNYEPGSTLKMFVAAMALEEGVVTEGDRFYDPGYIVVRDKKIHCWDLAGHKDESFVEGFQNSCNPVFAQVGLRSGKTLLYKYLRGFGFGQPTGVEQPGEEIGLLIPEARAGEVDTAAIAIGQSIAVTPIQMITAISAMANGGYLYRPHLVRAVEDPGTGEVKEIEPRVVRQVVSRTTASQMNRLLQKVVMEGTAKKGYLEGYAVAGKTGTAEVPGQQGYQAGKYVSSFAGFAPAENPRIAVLIVVSEPKGALYHGGDVAAPVFQSLGRDILQYLGVPANPNQPRPKAFQEAEPQPPAPAPGGLVRVPNVTGFPLEEARKFLEENGFRPVGGGQGLVAGQEPAGGSYGKRGSAVTLRPAPFNRAAPPAEVLVPDLRGLTIRRAGFILNDLALNFSAAGSGLASGQNPPPGSRVPRGAIIRVEFTPPVK